MSKLAATAKSRSDPSGCHSLQHLFVANFGQGSSSLTEVKRAASQLRLFEVECILSRFAAHWHIPPDRPAAVRCAPVQNRIERLSELNLGRIKVLGLADEPDSSIRLRRPGDRPEPGYSAGGPAHPHDAAHGKPTILASFDVDAEVVVALAPEKQLAGETSIGMEWDGIFVIRYLRGSGGSSTSI